MYKIKKNKIYSLEYEIKLNRGKSYKANDELNKLLNKLVILEDETEEKDFEKIDKVKNLIINKKKMIKTFNENKCKAENEKNLIKIF